MGLNNVCRWNARSLVEPCLTVRPELIGCHLAGYGLGSSSSGKGATKRGAEDPEEGRNAPFIFDN
jgi:hypothetical protein